MASKVPVLGVRHLDGFGLTRESTRGPVLRLGRGERPLAPGGHAVARCRPYPLQRALGVLRPSSSWRIPGGDFLREAHEAPAEACACGIYAWNSLDPRFEDAHFGVYLGWGRVYHGRGYWRAQYVKPLAIGKLGRPERFDPEGRRARWIAGIAERYDLPVLQGGDVDSYATMFGRWPETERAAS